MCDLGRLIDGIKWNGLERVEIKKMKDHYKTQPKRTENLNMGCCGN